MNKNVKSVCIDARLFYAPGIGSYLKNLLPHFKESPWKWYALMHTVEVKKFSAWNYIEPIPVASPIYSIKEQIELPLKIPSVDLFWSPHYNVPVFPIRARRRLVTIHDVFHLAFASSLKRTERFYARIMMQAALRLSDHIITVSDFSKNEIENYTHLKRPITVIHHGVNLAFSPHAQPSGRSTLSFDTPFLLYVGSFKWHKNLKGLIEAFSILRKKRKDNIKLVIVGGELGMRHCEDVKQLCIAHPELEEQLCFMGKVADEELPSLYRNAELFIFPSFYEGFGLPPLEAMASGCPTVVARAGAMPEVCAEGALYMDPHAPEAMAALIDALLQDPGKRKDLAARGWERSKLFCWKRSAEMHWRVIEDLMG